MSEYFAQINWLRSSNENYIDNKYSRTYEWTFDGVKEDMLLIHM